MIFFGNRRPDHAWQSAANSAVWPHLIGGKLCDLRCDSVHRSTTRWPGAIARMARFGQCALHTDLDPFIVKRIKVWILQLSMIFSENRLPLFGIML
jgi:hypothetical protein